MYLMKRILAVILCCISLPLFSQKVKTPSTLLWRISGNGLEKSSYLYGSIHVTDKRVFQLGDSLFKVMNETEAFAAELDMGNLGSQLINKMLAGKPGENEKNAILVKDAVSNDIWNRYKKKLETRFGKKAEKITLTDLDLAETHLRNSLLKKGEMPTFLDAWLFGQARARGKWVGGIEELEDQLEHIAGGDAEEKIQQALFDDQYYDQSVERLIKAYCNQDLDTIDAIMYREESGQKDYIMIKRNLKMARRMDSLAAIRSTLFVVGAAHLPGDSGVITLLRGRGFTVTPVFSGEKISPEKFAVKNGQEKWYPVEIKDSAYTLQMPGTAEGIGMMQSMGMDMKTYFDMASLKMYMTICIDLPENRAALGADSIFKALEAKYEEKGKKFSVKTIMVNQLEGREFRLDNEEGSLLMQAFLPRMEKAVINAEFSVNDKQPDDKSLARFFESFHYNPDKPARVVLKKKTGWLAMGDSARGFYAEMPMQPEFKKESTDNEGVTIYSWQGFDMGTAVYYGIVVSVMQEEMHQQAEDSVRFEAIKENMRERMDKVKITDSAAFTLDGYPAYSITALVKTNNEEMEARMLDVLRGGTAYHVYTVRLPSENKQQATEQFFNAFKLVPYPYDEWKTITAPDQSFTTTLPFTLKRGSEKGEDDMHPDAERFISYDSLAGLTGFIDRTVLPSWFWYASDTAFLRARSEEYYSYSDSLISYSATKEGNNAIVNLTVQPAGSSQLKKVKMILTGTELYELFGHFTAADLSNGYNRFFDEFTVGNSKPAINHPVSKAGELAATISRADSATLASIKRWWEYIPFGKDDLPHLQSVLLKLYPDFDTSYYNYKNMNGMLFSTIEKMDTVNNTLDYIRKNYRNIDLRNEYIKPYVFSYLAGLQTGESFDLLNHSFNITSDVYFNYHFYDSALLTARLYPDIMTLADKEGLWKVVAEGAVQLLDSNLLSKKSIQEKAKYFVNAARNELSQSATHIEERSYLYADLIRLLGVAGTPEAQTLLTRFSKLDYKEVKLPVILAMLECKMQPDTKAISALAAADEYRHRLYDGLKRAGRLSLFPAAYLSQKQLGQSKLYEYITEDDDAPEILVPVTEKVIMYKGKKQRFWIYKLSFSADEPDYYMGVAGPYDLNAKNFDSNHNVTSVYWDKNFESNKIDSLLKEYLAQLEGYE